VETRRRGGGGGRGVEKEEGILKANTRIEVLGLGFKVYSKPGFRV
jgi:hypothetical protein